MENKEFKPKGWFWPSIMGGIDLIDPIGNIDRFKVSPDKNTYPRVKAEISYRAEIMTIYGKSYWFNAGFRYFHELDASAGVRAAGLSTHKYLAASIDLPMNLAITYTNGKLPFDLKSQQVWALGYKLVF